MGSFQWCIPDPNEPDGELCEDIPVKIDLTRLTPDPESLLGRIPDQLVTDIAVLVGVDQLAASVQDEELRAYLADAVDEAAARLAIRLPDGAALKRIG